MEKRQPLQQKLFGKLISSLQKTETRSMLNFCASSQAVLSTVGTGPSRRVLPVRGKGFKERKYGIDEYGLYSSLCDARVIT
jgi:hypothetical protein